MEGGRLLFSVIWGGGVVIVFTVVLWARALLYRRHHDRRAFRDLLEAFSLWLVAFGASAAIAAVVIWPEATNVRSLMTSLALGAFFGAGIIIASDALASLRRE